MNELVEKKEELNNEGGQVRRRYLLVIHLLVVPIDRRLKVWEHSGGKSNGSKEQMQSAGE
jgi:hypothetical protein